MSKVGRPGSYRSVGAYLRPLSKASGHFRTQARAVYADLATSEGVAPYQRGFSNKRREMLLDALFAVQNRIESKKGGDTDNRIVVVIQGIRHKLEADLGWADPWPDMIYD